MRAPRAHARSPDASHERRRNTAAIYVLAGANGAGKSSIGGEALRAAGVQYFNPDAGAARIREALPSLGPVHANAIAWNVGREMLERAIAGHDRYAFETTLGGDTITRLLEQAADAGIALNVWFVGLDHPDRNVARVRERVAHGGHDIPEADIRRRYDAGRLNLVRLLPRIAALRVYDNSFEADPARGRAPRPVLLLHTRHRRVVGPRDLAATPEWAKPVVAAALTLARASSAPA